jgi:hypothetical protein
VVVLSQSNRTQKKGEDFDTTHVAESDKITHPADVVIGIVRIKDSENAVELHFGKNREGGTNKLVLEMDWTHNMLKSPITLFGSTKITGGVS